MAFIDEHIAKFENLNYALHENNSTQLKREANGGNSILFTFPPKEENLYIEKAFELLNDPNKFTFIDVSKLFVEYIDEDGIEGFVNLYEELQPTSHKLFMSKEDPHIDLFDKIIHKIIETVNDDTTPILIKTGALYGTGIENINITDNSDIMNLKLPIVIFYPGEMNEETLYFLNTKEASKYRCTVIK
jgi:hypothetical protein